MDTKNSKKKIPVSPTNFDFSVLFFVGLNRDLRLEHVFLEEIFFVKKNSPPKIFYAFLSSIQFSWFALNLSLTESIPDTVANTSIHHDE